MENQRYPKRTGLQHDKPDHLHRVKGTFRHAYAPLKHLVRTCELPRYQVEHADYPGFGGVACLAIQAVGGVGNTGAR